MICHPNAQLFETCLHHIRDWKMIMIYPKIDCSFPALEKIQSKKAPQKPNIREKHMQCHKQFSDSRNSWWMIVGVLRKCGCSVKELQLTVFNTHLKEDENSWIRLKWSPGITLLWRLNTPHRNEIAGAFPLLPEVLCLSPRCRNESCEKSWTLQLPQNSGPPPNRGCLSSLPRSHNRPHIALHGFLKQFWKPKSPVCTVPVLLVCIIYCCNFRTFTSHWSAKLKANYERPLRTAKVSCVSSLAYCPSWEVRLDWLFYIQHSGCLFRDVPSLSICSL